MSAFVAAYDGQTCCNCGQPAQEHLRMYGAAPDSPAWLVCPEHTPEQPAPAASAEPGAHADAAGLARGLLGLIQHGRWWQDRGAYGLFSCRACGHVLPSGHHPACRYHSLAEQIGRLP